MSPDAERLRELAAKLSQGNLLEVEDTWFEIKQDPGVQALYKKHPDQLSAIVAFARMRAGGTLKSADDDPERQRGYDEMVGKVIASLK